MSLQRTLHKLINRTQTGYNKGRFITENARSVLDISNYCEGNGSNSINKVF